MSNKIKPINYGTRANVVSVQVSEQVDKLWNDFNALPSLISPEAFKIIEKINQLEYITK